MNLPGPFVLKPLFKLWKPTIPALLLCTVFAPDECTIVLWLTPHACVHPTGGPQETTDTKDGAGKHN